MINSVLFSLLLAVLVPHGNFPDDTELNYAVNLIPDSLKTGSHAVVRVDKMELEISSLTNASFKCKIAVTLFDESADNFGVKILRYDRSSKITSFSGKIYNTLGVQADKLKSSDIKDLAAPGGSLYDDDRIKYARIVPSSYPCTIEFEYEIVYNSLLFLPSWTGFAGENTGVENSEFEISTPASVHLRYRELNMPSPAKIVLNGKNTTYHWEVSGLKPIHYEQHMPSGNKIFPTVLVSVDDFVYERTHGNLSSWKSIGEYSYELNKGRDSLPQPTVEKIRNLVENIPGRRDRIKKIYEYLQNNTRYISVQLGIGGFQAFDANYVDDHGFGDCKALTNYMHAMLKAVNIPSYWALVKSGNFTDDIFTDFPSMQFDHVILCVPDKSDTIWLECTDQHIPFNFLGGFTCDRHVLLLTENGGILVKTPAYSREMNIQKQSGVVKITSSGEAKANVETVSGGLQYSLIRDILFEDKDSQVKDIYKQINIPDFNIDSFNIVEDKGASPSVSEKLDLTLNHYITASGKRLFFQPNLMNQVEFNSGVNETRMFDLAFKYPYIDEDSIVFMAPPQFHIEFIPKETSLESRFGKYSVRVLSQPDKIIYLRRMEWNKGEYSKDFYPEYREFVKKINAADKIKIVLVKTT